MRVKVGIVVMALVGGVLGAPGSSAAVQYEPRVVLTPAKSRTEVVALGKVYGARAKENVRIKLFKYFRASNSYKLKAKKLERTRWTSQGYRTYRAEFPRPKKGLCELRVKVARMPETELAHLMPCTLQNFAKGSADLAARGVNPGRTIEVLIADNDKRRGHGLMYKEQLPLDKGMAFLYPDDTGGGFWMKNTLIALSIAFFSADGKIVRILDMEPCEEDPCPVYDPGVTYRGALEVNKGRFDAWGIAEGDRIEVHRAEG